MEEVYIVLARFILDDVPVYSGTLEDCQQWCDDACVDADWDSLRKTANNIMGMDISTDPIAFVILCARPPSVEMVELVEVDEDTDE